MNKKFCDRCSNEIKKEEVEQYRITHLWTFEENKVNDFWELCKSCSKQLLEFMYKK